MSAANQLLPAHLGIVEWFRPGEHQRVERVIGDIRSVGAGRLRTGISWADWYSPGGEEWYDWLIPRLSRELELLPCVLYTPPSIGVEPKTSAPPRRPLDYADFVDLLINRHGKHFEYIELWNEPNNLSEWDWTLDPHWNLFAEMIGAAAHWARHLGKKTVLGGMSPIDSHWLCRMFDLGVMDHIDVVGIHGFPDIFDYTWKGWERNITMVRDLLAGRASGCDVWITEAGFSTWQHDELKQMKVFLEFIEADATRSYWYGIDDLDPRLAAVDRFHLDEREYFFGLRTADGSPKLLHRLLSKGGLPAVRRVASATERRQEAGDGKGVLITGGAGFIGTNLAKRLLEMGERVIIYDNLSRPGAEKNLLWLNDTCGDRLDVRICDVRNRQMLEQAVRDADHVFHFAAQVAVTTSIERPEADFSINGSGTLTLLETIRTAPSPPSLLFTSTNKVYGGIGCPLRKHGARYEPADAEIRTHGFAEDTPLDFLSPYGCSKGSVDQYVLDYARTYGLAAAVFRMSCIYGPHQMGNEDQGWVAHFVIQALRGNPITIYGDGCQIRDLLFVEDLVDAFLVARRRIGEISGQAFNIGGGPERSVSLLELLELVRKLHGRLPRITRSDWRTGDQRYYVSDTRRFTSVTGWKPRHSVADGVRQLYDWLNATLVYSRTPKADYGWPKYDATGAEA